MYEEDLFNQITTAFRINVFSIEMTKKESLTIFGLVAAELLSVALLLRLNC